MNSLFQFYKRVTPPPLFSLVFMFLGSKTGTHACTTDKQFSNELQLQVSIKLPLFLLFLQDTSSVFDTWSFILTWFFFVICLLLSHEILMWALDLKTPLLLVALKCASLMESNVHLYVQSYPHRLCQHPVHSKPLDPKVLTSHRPLSFHFIRNYDFK